VIHALAQRLIEADADARKNASAEEIEEALCDVKPGGEAGKPNQRRHAAAGQHPVIDLQHEHRAGEHEQVAHRADQAGRDEGAAARAERGGELGAIEGDGFFQAERHCLVFIADSG